MTGSAGFLKSPTKITRSQYYEAYYDLKVRIQNPTERDEIINSIKEMMGGGTIEYHNWYNELYKETRAKGDNEGYENGLNEKYQELLADIEEIERSDEE